MNFDNQYRPPQNQDTVALTPPNLLQSCIKHDIHVHKTKNPPLKELNDINIQQALITKDLLFVLLGFEGYYIRFSDSFDSSDVIGSIQGPDFKIAKNLDISLKFITRKIIKFGRYYCSINKFLENYDNERFGKVIQNLCHSIVQFKNRYELLIGELEVQFKMNTNFNLNTFDTMLNDLSNPMGHLYDIINLIHTDTIQRYESEEKHLKLDERIDLFIDGSRLEVCKGGAVLEIIQNRIKSVKGDSISTKFLMELFEQVSKDYLNSLNQWLLNGIIDDPFREFLIKQTQFQKFVTPKMQLYWDEIFKIRYDGIIDQFMDKNIQSKILLTGKFLNIFKYCCEKENLDCLNDNFMPISSLLNQDFELKVNQCYERANKLVMKLIFQGYNLIQIIQYYKRVYLLNNSSIDRFIEDNFNDLCKNKFKLSVTKLTKNFNSLKVDKTEIDEILNNNLEFSVSSLNFYELAKEVLNIEPITNFDSTKIEDLIGKRSKIINSSSSEFDVLSENQMTAISVNLNVDLPFPINLIINYNFNLQYQLIFNNQLYIKFIDKTINNTWKEMNLSDVWTHKFESRRISKWIIRSRVLLNRMRDFINELHYYLSFEIIDSNHSQLLKKLSEVYQRLVSEPISTEFTNVDNSYKGVGNYNHLFNKVTTTTPQNVADVTNLINTMSTYLNNILRDSFLAHEQIMNNLSNLLHLIVQFNQFLTKLKTSLVRSDEALFAYHSELYPDTFKETSSEGSKDVIYENLNEELNKFYDGFNILLTRFMSCINGEFDNSSQQFLNLFEVLENCFPN